MRRVLLIDTSEILARETPPDAARAFGAYVETVMDLYARFVPHQLGFVSDCEPRSRVETLGYEWARAVTDNVWVRPDFAVLDILYTLALQVYQQETLQNAHVLEAEAATPSLARPKFPYDAPTAPADLTWQVILHTTRSLPPTLHSIPGIRAPLSAGQTTTSAPLRLVPRLRLSSRMNFASGGALLKKSNLDSLAERTRTLPGSFASEKTDLF